MSVEPHPESLLRAPDRRPVSLKVHRCNWSGDHPENSLAAIRECYRAGVARAEIDFGMLLDADFLVTHDEDLAHATTGTGRVSVTTRSEARRLRFRRPGRQGGEASNDGPPLLSEVVDLILAEPGPTLLELDIKDFEPWPWPRVEELARLIEPVKERVVVGGCPDWNLRRLLRIDPSLPVGFDPQFYLDWAPEDDDPEPLPGVRGAYGYLDAHVLARERLGLTADYLADRLGGLSRLVPGSRDVHLSLAFFERMLEDGLNAVELFHAAGQRVDVWTLDADTPRWRDRLARAVAAGADIVTTNTPRALAAAGDPAG